MNSKTIMRSHWLPFPFLLALPLMMWVHHLLGLSDALMIQTPPGEREAHTYNWVMVLVGWAGLGFFCFHTLSLWHRGWRWGVGKLLFLATYWTVVLMFM
jgi:hypothetical protein